MLAGAVVGLRRGRSTIVARRAEPEAGLSEEDSSALAKNCSGATPRRQVTVLGSIAVAGSVEGAKAETVKVNKDRCEDCGGEGIIECLTCLGSGQIKMLGFRDGSVEAQYQFVSCPDCDGVGMKLCPRCLGTGLSSQKLKGFLRDPIFKKVLYRLKRQKVDLETLPKLQEEVMDALEEAKRRMAAATEV